MWDIIITRIVGHALARSIFKESPEEEARRIAEEQQKIAEAKRKERERFLRELPWMILAVVIAVVVVYFVWKAYT
jgi:cell division septal protein FtsQ